MKTILVVILGLLLSPQVFAQSAGAISGSNSNANSGSSASSNQSADSGAAAVVDLTFGGSEQRRTQTVHTTPNVYAPPSMFGGVNNCGQSSTFGVGATGFGIGGSLAGESDACNAREDTSIAYKLGYKDVADMRFFCFGEDVNRKAYESTGRTCPTYATAKGLPERPVAAADNNRINNSQSQRNASRVVAATPVSNPQVYVDQPRLQPQRAQDLRAFYGSN